MLFQPQKLTISNLEKGTLTIDKNQQQLLHTIAFNILKTTFMYNESAA